MQKKSFIFKLERGQFNHKLCKKFRSLGENFQSLFLLYTIFRQRERLMGHRRLGYFEAQMKYMSKERGG